MEDFSQLIARRRSMRKFTGERLTPEETRRLLRAALMAPSSKGLHSTELVTVDDPAVLLALSRCKAQGGELLAGAPLAIAVVGDPAVSDVWVEDASVAATHILLQAEDMGLGACWVQMRERRGADGVDAERAALDLLAAPAGRRLVCLVAVGHKGMERKPQNEERLRWENARCGRY